MEGYCSTGQSPQWAVVPMEEEEEEEEEVRSLRCSTSNERVLCLHLCPVRPYSIIPHYLIEVTILEKKLLNTKCVF
jgi:hypothetical protein